MEKNLPNKGLWAGIACAFGLLFVSVSLENHRRDAPYPSMHNTKDGADAGQQVSVNYAVIDYHENSGYENGYMCFMDMYK